MSRPTAFLLIALMLAQAAPPWTLFGAAPAAGD